MKEKFIMLDSAVGEACIIYPEQILILRKLNISIKDIQRIFRSPGTDVVLEVLGKKAAHIDSEVALLQDLREIITDFIRQIREADFGREADVKMLYEKAAKIETRIANIPYQGNPSRINRLLDVTDKLKKGPDFLWFEEDGRAVWIWAVEDWVTEGDTAPYELITFEGGLYAAAMSMDGDDDIGGRIYAGILKWLEDSGFEPDKRPGRRAMCHMVNPTEEIRQALGYHQLDIYVPIRIRRKR